jgi:hypothetical protein
MRKLLLCLLLLLLIAPQADALGRLRARIRARRGCAEPAPVEPPAAVWYGWGAALPGDVLMPVAPPPPLGPGGCGPLDHGHPLPGPAVVPPFPHSEPPLMPEAGMQEARRR